MISQLVVVALQRCVIILALALDRVGQRDQAGVAEILRERLFGERAADAAVAIFEGMNAHEVEMREPARVSAGNGFFPPGAVSLNQAMKRFISVGTARTAALEVHLALVNGAGDHLHGVGVRPVAANDLDDVSPLSSILCHSNIVSSVSVSAKLR